MNTTRVSGSVSRIGTEWQSRKYVSHHKERTYQVRRNPETGKIEKKLISSEGKAKESRGKSFDSKYRNLVEYDKSLYNPRTMTKTIPDYLRAALIELAHSQNEFAIGIDFEAFDDLPERVLANRGAKYRVRRDADFEIDIHTHPPSFIGKSLPKGFKSSEKTNEHSFNCFPSDFDISGTTFTRPNIIAYIDESGKGKFVIVRSLHEDMSRYDEMRKFFDEKITDLLNIYSDRNRFSSTENRDNFLKELRKAANEQGYDFKETNLKEKIRMRFDDNDE